MKLGTIFFFLLTYAFCWQVHERNYFRLSQNENNCEEACLAVGGTPCVHEYFVPDNDYDVEDDSKYDIVVVCCDRECQPGIPGDPDHYLPYCKGKYLKFVC